MAAACEKFQDLINFPSFPHYIQYFISKVLGNAIIENEFSDGFKILKSKQNISTFVVLNPSCAKARRNNCDLIVKTDVFGKLKLEEVSALHNGMCQCPGIKKYFLSSYVNPHRNIHIVLNREFFIKDVFEMVIMRGVNYGLSYETANHSILINCGDVSIRNCELTVGQLRSVLLCNHMAAVWRRNRWKVDIYCPDYSDEVFCKSLKDIEHFGISNLTTLHQKDTSRREVVENSLRRNLLKSPYRTDLTTTGSTDNDSLSIIKNSNVGEQLKEDTLIAGDQHCVSSKRTCATVDNKTATQADQNIRLNMAKFTEDLRNSETTMNGSAFNMFYKNVKHINVSSVWNDVLYLELLKEHTDKKRQVIHVCGQEKSVYWQKVSLTWRSLTTPENLLAENQMFLRHAGCASKVSADELLRLRTKQVKHSYIMKYGSIVNDDSWSETIIRMAVSVIKLEILLVPLNSQVKLDLRDSDDFPASCRQALFVLYNCARLAKILEKYNSEVAKGIYPGLPTVNDVDFSVLKDEVEWYLILKYVANYPSIVEHVASCVDGSSVLIKCGSNKIAQFLVSLSQDISSYYSHVHILGEAREHLYPVMFARLYLVKVLHQDVLIGESSSILLLNGKLYECLKLPRQLLWKTHYKANATHTHT